MLSDSNFGDRVSIRSQGTILMLSTSPETQGGIAAVIKGYMDAGLFDRWPVLHVATHCDGGRIRKLLVAVSALARYLTYLCTRRVVLVHVHAASNASFWRKLAFILMAFLCRVPVIFHLHGGGFLDFYRRRFGAVRRRVIRFVLNHSAYIIVLSREWHRRVSTITGNPNIVTIANPIDAGCISYTGVCRPGTNAVLFLGRLEKEKGILDLVDALATVRRTCPNAVIRFAGHGNVKAIRRRASDVGVSDAVEFLGWVQGAAKAQALAEATVYALPSYMEGLPMGVLEAMAVGLPVVATTVGGIPDIVEDGVTGLLISPGDKDGLARALSLLLSDPALRRRMGVAARAVVEEGYTPQRIVPMIESLYRTLGATPLPS
jgi:glycosyltransferase involved in cell wall biosynthesis